MNRHRYKWLCLLLMCLMVVILPMTACGDLIAMNGDDTASKGTVTEADTAAENVYAETDSETEEAETVAVETVPTETELAETEEVTSDVSADDGKEHEFTLVMDESVYPVDFHRVTFYVVWNTPGETFSIDETFYVARVEGDREIEVGQCGVEMLWTVKPPDENTCARFGLDFGQGLFKKEPPMEGTYRIRHFYDRDVYVEFELKN